MRGPLQSAIVSYWVDEGHTGHGLASQAVAEVVDLAFGELELHRLEAGTLVDNVASQRVLEKNRFERFGLAPRYLLIAGEWRDHILFQRTLRLNFARSVHEVAPELVGAELYVDGVGGQIVEVEAYDHDDPAAHGFRGPHASATRRCSGRPVTRTCIARTESTGA